MGYLFRLTWAVLRRIGPSQISVIAAGVAFYALLAVFPAITAILALAGLFTEPDAVVSQFETISRFIPEDAARILTDEAAAVTGAGNDGLSLALALGVGFAIYLSTRATTALIYGLNVAHQRSENRGFFRFWITVILLTATMVFGMVILFLLLVGLPTVLNYLPEEILPGSTNQTLRASRWIVVGVLLIFGLSLLYRFGPADRAGRTGVKRPWRWFTAGSALAAMLWFAGSFGFSLYVTHIANYNASFGSLGGVIILLTWLWLSAFVVLLGAVLDAEIRRPRLAEEVRQNGD